MRGASGPGGGPLPFAEVPEAAVATLSEHALLLHFERVGRLRGLSPLGSSMQWLGRSVRRVLRPVSH